MFPIGHFIRGFFKNLANPKISNFAFVSANNKLDKTAVIQRRVKIKGSSVGRHSYIGANTDVENAQIGNFCSIADYCRIGMSAHSIDKLSTSPIFTLKNNGCQEQWTDVDAEISKDDSVWIGNDVWIGSHVLVNGGVRIGDGAVIGAGAVVVRDIPPFAISVGVPARVIRYRFKEDTISKLEEIKWWNKSDEELKGKMELFQSSADVNEVINLL